MVARRGPVIAELGFPETRIAGRSGGTLQVGLHLMKRFHRRVARADFGDFFHHVHKAGLGGRFVNEAMRQRPTSQIQELLRLFISAGITHELSAFHLEPHPQRGAAEGHFPGWA